MTATGGTHLSTSLSPGLPSVRPLRGPTQKCCQCAARTCGAGLACVPSPVVPQTCRGAPKTRPTTAPTSWMVSWFVRLPTLCPRPPDGGRYVTSESASALHMYITRATAWATHTLSSSTSNCGMPAILARFEPYMECQYETASSTVPSIGTTTGTRSRSSRSRVMPSSGRPPSMVSEVAKKPENSPMSAETYCIGYGRRIASAGTSPAGVLASASERRRSKAKTCLHLRHLAAMNMSMGHFSASRELMKASRTSREVGGASCGIESRTDVSGSPATVRATSREPSDSGTLRLTAPAPFQAGQPPHLSAYAQTR